MTQYKDYDSTVELGLKNLEYLVILVTGQCFGAMLGDFSHACLALGRSFHPYTNLRMFSGICIAQIASC